MAEFALSPSTDGPVGPRLLTDADVIAALTHLLRRWSPAGPAAPDATAQLVVAHARLAVAALRCAQVVTCSGRDAAEVVRAMAAASRVDGVDRLVSGTTMLLTAALDGDLELLTTVATEVSVTADVVAVRGLTMVVRGALDSAGFAAAVSPTTLLEQTVRSLDLAHAVGL